ATLPELADAVAARRTPAATARAEERLARQRAAGRAALDELRTRAHAEAAKSPIRALALVEAIGAALPEDAIVVDETLSSAPGLRQLVASNDARSYFAMRGGGIGWGLPAAIGIKLAQPQRPVVALIGDGSAMYNIQALWTAAHERVPVVFVIFN